MSIQDEITCTKARIADLKDDIRNLEDHGRSLALKAMGLEVGSVIEVKSRGKAFLVSVTGAENWSASYVGPVGLRIKKDGTVGTQVASWICDWRKVEPPK